MPQAFARFRTTFYLLGLADRKSTRLNSSHSQISYAVFCLKKKKIQSLVRQRTALTHAKRLVESPPRLVSVLTGNPLICYKRILSTTILFAWLAAFYHRLEE